MDMHEQALQNHVPKSEEEFLAIRKEKRKNQTPRRKMYSTAESTEQYVLLASGPNISEEKLKSILPGLSRGLGERSLGLGVVKLRLYPSNLVRLYPDQKMKRQLNREYRSKYYERNPDKKELTPEQKLKRKAYNERPDVKRRKMENNRLKRLFINQKLEENEKEYSEFVKRQKNLENGISTEDPEKDSDSTTEEGSEGEDGESLVAE